MKLQWRVAYIQNTSSMCPCIFAKILKILKILKTKSEVSQPPSSIVRLLKFSYFATTRQGQQDAINITRNLQALIKAAEINWLQSPQLRGIASKIWSIPVAKSTFPKLLFFKNFTKPINTSTTNPADKKTWHTWHHPAPSTVTIVSYRSIVNITLIHVEWHTLQNFNNI